MKDDQSMLGNVIGDIQHLLRNLQWVRIDCIRRGGNRVVHVVAQFDRNIIEDMYWMKQGRLNAIGALRLKLIILY